MIEVLSPASVTRALARLLGESERNVRAIVMGSLMLALMAAVTWLALQTGMGHLPEGNPGSAEVVQALLGLAALLFAAVPAALLAVGRMAAPMMVESFLA
jgi:hypothetical protein